MSKSIVHRIAYYTHKVAEKSSIHPAKKPPRAHTYRHQRLLKYKTLMHEQIASNSLELRWWKSCGREKRRLMDINFQGFDCELVFGHYANGNTAIQLVDKEDGMPVATASVNGEMIMPENIVGIKTWSENEGIREYLINSNVIKPELECVEQSGFVLIEYYQLTPEALEVLKKYKAPKQH